jgi:hypothetical protein
MFESTKTITNLWPGSSSQRTETPGIFLTASFSWSTERSGDAGDVGVKSVLILKIAVGMGGFGKTTCTFLSAQSLTVKLRSSMFFTSV